MSIRPVSRWLLATLTIVGLGSRVLAGPTPARICQAAKDKEAGKYGVCRLKAEARFAMSANNAKYTEALARCEAKYQAKWRALEAMAVAKRGVCPSVGDQAAIQEVIDGHTTNIAAALGGGVLQDYPADFEAQSGQGPITLHSEEHLASSDKGVAMLRRLLTQQIKVVQEGGNPQGVHFDESQALVKVLSGNFFK